MRGGPQPDHLADHEHRRRLDVYFAPRDLFQRRFAHALPIRRSILQERDRIARRPPAVDQAGRDRRAIVHAHQDHQRARVPEGRPVHFLHGLPMAWQHGEGCRHPSIRERDARQRRCCRYRRYARDHLHVETVLRQKLEFLASPPEHHRIAALQPHHRSGRIAQPQIPGINLGLELFLLAALLARVHEQSRGDSPAPEFPGSPVCHKSRLRLAPESAPPFRVSRSGSPGPAPTRYTFALSAAMAPSPSRITDKQGGSSEERPGGLPDETRDNRGKFRSVRRLTSGSINRSQWNWK